MTSAIKAWKLSGGLPCNADPRSTPPLRRNAAAHNPGQPAWPGQAVVVARPPDGSPFRPDRPGDAKNRVVQNAGVSHVDGLWLERTFAGGGPRRRGRLQSFPLTNADRWGGFPPDNSSAVQGMQRFNYLPHPAPLKLFGQIGIIPLYRRSRIAPRPRNASGAHPWRVFQVSPTAASLRRARPKSRTQRCCLRRPRLGGCRRAGVHEKPPPPEFEFVGVGRATYFRPFRISYVARFLLFFPLPVGNPTAVSRRAPLGLVEGQRRRAGSCGVSASSSARRA